jgi:hypothetical protein
MLTVTNGTFNATQCTLNYNSEGGTFTFTCLDFSTIVLTGNYTRAYYSATGTTYPIARFDTYPGTFFLTWQWVEPKNEGWTPFLIGIFGLVLMAASWFVAKYFWSQDEYAKAIGYWFAMFFVGLAIFTVIITG